jgi:23S rRNA (cytosine1962-C5)-methyltransferase
MATPARRTIAVPESTAVQIRRGHPWVFRDRPWQAAVGDLVRVTDDKQKTLGFGLYDEGPIAVRMLGDGEPPDLAGLLLDRFARADRFRQRMIPEQTDAYRLIAGEGDGLGGLVVDRYAGLAVVRLYAAAWEPHLGLIIDALRKLGWVEAVYRRLGVGRVDGAAGGVALFGAEPPDALVIHEAGLKMLVRPKVGQKTGLFLDQREHRQLVRRWAAGRVVANLFGYTGGFSLAAVAGGAARVTTVDIAPDAIDDARENFRLNGFDLRAHAFEVADVFAWRATSPLTLLIADPPSFTHDKQADDAATRGYRRLHTQLGPMVARDGLLATSSCTARLSMDAWQRAIADGLASHGAWSWQWTSQEPPDHPTALGHPEGRYLKFAILRRR